MPEDSVDKIFVVAISKDIDERLSTPTQLSST